MVCSQKYIRANIVSDQGINIANTVDSDFRKYLHFVESVAILLKPNSGKTCDGLAERVGVCWTNFGYRQKVIVETLH